MTLLPCLQDPRFDKSTCNICFFSESTFSNTIRNLLLFNLRLNVCSKPLKFPKSPVLYLELRTILVSLFSITVKVKKSDNKIDEKWLRTLTSSQTCCTRVVFPTPTLPIIGRISNFLSEGLPLCNKKLMTCSLSTCRPNISQST